MIIVSIILSAICVIAGKYRYKDWINPYSAFGIIWLIVCLMIALGNSAIYEPRESSLQILLLGILGYLVSIFIPEFNIRKEQEPQSLEKSERTVKINMLIGVSVVVVLLSLIQAWSSIQGLLQGHSFAEVRTEYFNVESNLFLYYLRMYVTSPLRYALIALAIYLFFDKSSYPRIIYINAVVAVILMVISSGSRYILLNVILMILCGMSFSRHSSKLQGRKRIAVYSMIAAGIIGVFFLTDSRSTYLMTVQNMSIYEKVTSTTYSYYCGSVTYLQQIIDSFPFIEGSTFGINLVAGFISPICALFSFAGIIPYPDVLNIFGIYGCATLQIGPSTYFNAMPTVFGYFFMDYGLPGVFIESAIAGYAFKMVYTKGQKGSIVFELFYLLIFMQIFNFSTRWFFFTPEYALSFIYLPLFIKNTSRYRDNRISSISENRR